VPASTAPTPRALRPPRVVRTRRGVRLVQGRDVLSEVLAQPGPTHGFFDALAACIVAFAPPAPRPRVALLGFAAGGVVAPLRAMGFAHPLRAVDLSREAEVLFRDLSSAWAGDVRLTQAEASAWIRRQRQPWDVVLEDLTVPHHSGAIKPPVSVGDLPQLLASRLTPGGVVVTNALPVPWLTWEELIDRLAAPHRTSLVVTFDEFENRIVLAGESLPTARQTAARLRQVLTSIRSRQARRFAVQRRG